MTQKLLLNQARNVESDKSNMTIPIDIGTNRDVIVDDHFNELVNQYNVYLDEREQCTTIRLTANVNIIASNVIFNSVTEIVKYEGSSDCKCLNTKPTTIPTTMGKPATYEWGGENIGDAVMDTQISSDTDEYKNYTYLCGIDIFNNHNMRAKTKYPIYEPNQYTFFSPDFNTISCLVRDRFGIKHTKFWKYYTQSSNDLYDNFYEHRYNLSNIMTFEESLQDNMINRDGWIGFYNKGLMPSVKNNKKFGIENVINNETPNKFIDLFPGRDRYSFIPHYNKYRKRYEKNWEYCLTYPCDSTTENIPFINKYLDTLKIAFIDETEASDDGVYRCVIYTVSKHGLNADDTINLYRSKEGLDSMSEMIEGSVVVDTVIDDYCFTVYTSDWVCKKWVSVFDKEELENYNIEHVGGVIYTINRHGVKTRLISVNDYLNIDFDEEGSIGSQNLSFAKTVEGVQCRYYVRIFSRFPNFDFYNNELTQENIYSEEPISGKRIIDLYSNIQFEKQSTETMLGFSRNAYGDNIGQIVYNDDIDIDLIMDNLGRPLTSLYLTFFKTNYGRKEWYGKNTDQGIEPDPGNVNVEWSRCFGKLNCGFEYSPYIDEERWNTGNIRVMNNVNATLGLTEGVFYSGGGEDGDEIIYNKQTRFYGDLCMYSSSECMETIIQDCCHRFNTMQRETGGNVTTYGTHNLFSKVFYDNIVYDDNTQGKLFKVSHNEYDSAGSLHPEGYFYHPNHEVPVRTLSTQLMEFNPEMLDVVEFSRTQLGTVIARTVIENYFNNDTNLYMYDSQNGEDYQCNIINILDVNVVEFTCQTYQGEINPSTCKLYERHVEIPSYAEIVPGKTGSYRWRDVIQNGFEDTEGTIEEYPFVNGRLYIHRDINLFLRRQDPFGEYGLSSSAIYFGLPQVTGERNQVEDGTEPNANDAIKESDIKC